MSDVMAVIACASERDVTKKAWSRTSVVRSFAWLT